MRRSCGLDNDPSFPKLMPATRPNLDAAGGTRCGSRREPPKSSTVRGVVDGADMKPGNLEPEPVDFVLTLLYLPTVIVPN